VILTPLQKVQHVELKTALGGLFMSISGHYLVFFVVFFSRFGLLLQVTGEIDLDPDRRVNETNCPEIAWKRGYRAHALDRPPWRRRQEVHTHVARWIAANTHQVSCPGRSPTPFAHLDSFHGFAGMVPFLCSA
jgi:hypothetical protein